ncbi:MAG: hypothetical protein O6758_03850, partial [Planctomycetota bacterium]|nr:hypothetical protein [Planctomycetota bacterium]
MVMWLTVFPLTFCVGLALLWIGLHGKRINNHPWCRKCKYDLVGSPEVPAICPECGVSLKKQRSVRIGQRRKRPALSALATVVLILTVSTAGWVGWRESRDFDWNTVKPVWWLKQESTSSNATVAGTARLELLRRLDESIFSIDDSDGLSKSQINNILEHALTIQADPHAVWSPQWGDFVQVAWRHSLVTQDQIRRYLRNAFQPGIKITARKRVRNRAVLPIRFDYELCRSATFTSFDARFQLELATLGDWELPRSLLLQEPWDMRSVNRLTEWKRPLISLTPGDYTLRIRYRVVVTSKFDYSHSGPLAEWTVEQQTQVTVVDRLTEVVRAVTDERLADGVRAAIVVKPLRWDDNHNSVDIGGSIVVRRPPVDLAFEILLRAGGQEMRVGYLTAVKGGGIEEIDTQPWWPGPSLAGSDSVDIILRPSLSVAERSLNVTELWYQEIVIENVPLESSEV